MNLSSIIGKKKEYAEYMIKEITHICKTMGKRDPGSEGEKKACEYMADVLKNDCGCDRVTVESFEEHPGSFYGWITIDIILALISIVLIHFVPLVSMLLIILALVIMVMQFGHYKKFVDFLFPKKIGHNVTAIKSCKGEVKRRIMFNGHADAAWEWPVNYMFGGVGFDIHIFLGIGSLLYYLVLSIIAVCSGSAFTGVDGTLRKCALWGLILVPFVVALFFMWNKNRVVDGANDNLSGCYMGIALLKALKDEGIELEDTEVGVIICGSEEAGLRGSLAWAEAHKGEYDDVPTFIYSYDTIHDPKYLMTNYRDLNATVPSDKDVSDLFMESAEQLGIPCIHGMVPFPGGATDNAAFNKAGFRSTGITGLNHKLERYYHTRLDSYDNMNQDGLEGCFAVTAKVLENFVNGAKQ